MELRLFDRDDPDWLRASLPMERVGDDFTIDTPLLQLGTPYAVGVDGPTGPGHAFDPGRHAIPPHARGIVHRDLKPDNIIVLPHHDPTAINDDAHDEAIESIKVVDFGIAKLRDMTGEAAAKTNLTQVGTLLGTPNYMSPEQCRGAIHVDARTDLYAVGCILFEMLCGRPPFVGASSMDIMSAHLRDQPPVPSSIEPLSQHTARSQSSPRSSRASASSWWT